VSWDGDAEYAPAETVGFRLRFWLGKGLLDILATHLLGSGSQAVVYVGSYVSSGRRDADSGKNACMARVEDIYNRDDGQAGRQVGAGPDEA